MIRWAPSELVEQRLSEFPAVALLGPRQCGLAPRLERGFHTALDDIRPERAFVVYSGEHRYPVREGVKAIPLREMARQLAAWR